MRTIKLFVSLLFLAGILASCAKFENEQKEMGNSEKHDLSLNFDAGYFQENAGTKATMNAVIRASWETGDKVSVINVSKGKLLGGQLAAQSSGYSVEFSGTVTGTLTAGDNLVYVYPALKNNTEEEDFSTFTQDLTSQTYSPSLNKVAFCGYAADVYSTPSISKNITFTLATSYVHLNMSGLPTSMPVDSVAVTNINGSVIWEVKNGEFAVKKPTTENVDIITLKCTGITSSSATGNAIVRFAVPASAAASQRTLSVNDTIQTSYVTAARESSSYYNQLFANWNTDNEVKITKAGESTVYTTLAAFRDDVNSGKYESWTDYTVTVLKDINLTDNTWVPIGTTVFGSPIYGFYGTFDGNNHTIKLVKSDIADDYGLFMTIWGNDSEHPAIVKNLKLDVNLSAKSETKTWIGGLTDYAGGYTRFENVEITGSITTGRYGSGFIGYAIQRYSVFENCTNKANITAVIPTNASDNYSVIGGITSQAGSKTISFINCRNEGVLTADHSKDTDSPSYIGHMAGKGNYSSNDITITNCSFSNTATISGWNVKEGDKDTYPFEGYMTPTGTYTYGESTPNFGKKMIGGYYGSCTIDGVAGPDFMYPNGN